jgi:hypothetical protein
VILFSGYYLHVCSWTAPTRSLDDAFGSLEAVSIKD